MIGMNFLRPGEPRPAQFLLQRLMAVAPLVIAATCTVIAGTEECASNGACGPNEYCERPVGQCDGPGTCAQMPDGCGGIYDPVCGCDGRTWSNGCVASAAGVSVHTPWPCCPADVNLTQEVNVDDLVAVILSWGACPGCSADTNGDDLVDVDDLVTVIVAWGPCPETDAARCSETGGTWDPLSCGHYVCGEFPSCDAVIPGCDCGPGRTFMQGFGCVDDPECDG